MDADTKKSENDGEIRGEASPQPITQTADLEAPSNLQTKKEEDDDDDDEDEQEKIVEKSHNGRFRKRNKRFPKQIDGVDNTFIAIEPKSGKEVIWSERILPEKKTERENRFLTVVKKLKRLAHPFLVRFLDAWITKGDTGPRKLVFITERLNEETLKQYMCNSTRMKSLWRRHIGQLLSVLIFLHHLGITHGNLTKETIYYQNSGSLKVGPFILDGFFGQSSLASDIFALGLVALEIAAWVPTLDTLNLPAAERRQQMLDRLEDHQQRSFIETCLDPNPTTRPKIKLLLHHPAITEVPTLKLLSAKVLVSTMRVGPTEEGAATEVPGFATLLKDNLSHLEDETVIVEATFIHDQTSKSKLWKDFRSNLTFTSKYLEDVKNGFYPFFGYRFGSAIEQDDDDESLTALPADVSGHRAANLPNISAQAQSASSAASNTPSTTVTRKQSSSAAPTTDDEMHLPISRKLSTTNIPEMNEEVFTEAIDAPSTISLVEDLSLKSTIKTTDGVVASSSRNDSAHLVNITASKQNEPESAPHELLEIFNKPISDAGRENVKHAMKQDELVQINRRRSLPISFLNASPEAYQLGSYLKGIVVGTPTNAFQATSANNEPRMRKNSVFLVRSDKFNDIINLHAPDSLSSTGQSSCISNVPTRNDTFLGEFRNLEHLRRHRVSLNRQQSRTPRSSVISSAGLNTLKVLSQQLDTALNEDASSSQLPPAVPTQSSTVAAVTNDFNTADDVSLVTKLAKSEAEDDDEEEVDVDEEEEEEEDEEIDEDDDEKAVTGCTEKLDPQVIHVAAPSQPPNTPALFTHCQYTYIGSGRWQVYVQMWFVEERLKREAYLQVFDNEWHDYDRVADLFEASKCLNSSDRPTLIRLLALARHNLPLIEGEILYPSFFQNPQSSSINSQELYTKLVTLHIHQQARELLSRDSGLSISMEENQESTIEASLPPIPAKSEKNPPDSIFDGEVGPVTDEHVIIPTLCGSVPVTVSGFTTASDSSVCEAPNIPAPTVPIPCQHMPENLPDEIAQTNNTDFEATPVADSSSFFHILDVGSLAPRNAACAICDTHEYLHRFELPAYLIAPCYHCRDSLAREAKITPEDLLDLHLQHNIPWPAFLQALYKIPGDGRTIDELIAYDCKWRSRSTCLCFVPNGGSIMPPCVEFSWLYETDDHTANFPEKSEGIIVSQAASVDSVLVSNALLRNVEVSAIENGPASQPNLATMQASTPLEVTLSGQTAFLVPQSLPSDSKITEEVAVKQTPDSALPSAPTNRCGLPCASRHTRGALASCCLAVNIPQHVNLQKDVCPEGHSFASLPNLRSHITSLVLPEDKLVSLVAPNEVTTPTNLAADQTN